MSLRGPATTMCLAMVPTLPSERVTAQTAPVLLCQHCGAPLAPADDFCTHCGERTERTPDVVVPVRHESGWQEPEHATPVTAGRQRRWPWLVLLGLVAATALAAAVAAVRYHSELDSARSELSATEQQVERLEASRAQLAALLSGSKRLSERRALVLRQATGVLVGVDPLLSSVDELKRNTGRIQKARDALIESSGTAIDALVTLGNYLLERGAAADAARMDALIEDANAAIDAARGHARRLASVDAAYAAAAKRFDLRASRLSGRVEALRAELEKVAGA
jgi:hypothetical protein